MDASRSFADDPAGIGEQPSGPPGHTRDRSSLARPSVYGPSRTSRSRTPGWPWMRSAPTNRARPRGGEDVHEAPSPLRRSYRRTPVHSSCSCGIRNHLDLDQSGTVRCGHADPSLGGGLDGAGLWTCAAKARERPGSSRTNRLAVGGHPYTRSRVPSDLAAVHRSPAASPARRTYSQAPAVVRSPSRAFIACNRRYSAGCTRAHTSFRCGPAAS